MTNHPHISRPRRIGARVLLGAAAAVTAVALFASPAGAHPTPGGHDPAHSCARHTDDSDHCRAMHEDHLVGLTQHVGFHDCLRHGDDTGHC